MATTCTISSSRKLKILMLHGFTQTGHLFELKTKALKRALEKSFPPAPKPGHLSYYPGGVELSYPDAPIRLEISDIPGHDADGDHDAPEAYGWWRRKDDGGTYVYTGMDEGFARIAEVITDAGPFDGVIGFSQGGAAAGMVASLLDHGRRAAFKAAKTEGGVHYPRSFASGSFPQVAIQPPLKFAVSYSGFAPSSNPLYQAFYNPKIKTPFLHFIGAMDTVVSEERSLQLVEACEDRVGPDGAAPRLVYHPGGHFLPSSQKQFVAALVAFIRESVGEAESSGTKASSRDQRVEDMDVPF